VRTSRPVIERGIAYVIRYASIILITLIDLDYTQLIPRALIAPFVPRKRGAIPEGPNLCPSREPPYLRQDPPLLLSRDAPRPSYRGYYFRGERAGGAGKGAEKEEEEEEEEEEGDQGGSSRRAYRAIVPFPADAGPREGSPKHPAHVFPAPRGRGDRRVNRSECRAHVGAGTRAGGGGERERDGDGDRNELSSETPRARYPVSTAN